MIYLLGISATFICAGIACYFIWLFIEWLAGKEKYLNKVLKFLRIDIPQKNTIWNNNHLNN